MTRLRNLLERIAQGSGPSLGFGAAHDASSRLPAMVLIARCAGDIDAALNAALNDAGDAADALVVFAPALSPDDLPAGLDGRIWGAGGIPLRPDTIAPWRDAGADFTVSPLAGALVDAIDIANPTGRMTHGARIPEVADDALWRILAGIPLDFLVLDQSAVAGRWTLTGLGRVADAARRAGKHLAVRLGAEPPTSNELLALRQAGAVAVIAEANDLGADGLAQLKADLLALPRLTPTATRHPGAFEPS